ncbi:hypothetical protein [Streptomyces atacamensis]|jgi:hypothetical protein|uniref:hypothetical protein n=1 Tax=Streptomyces atacamensis TaxID=531966 RepID=UPI00399CC6DD
MILTRLLRILLGGAPPVAPMARLLVLDHTAFVLRVRTGARYQADGKVRGVRGYGRTLQGVEVRA